MGSPGGFTLTLATNTNPSFGLSRSVTFSGELSGALITGTITLNEQQDTSVVGGTAHYSAVATFPNIPHHSPVTVARTDAVRFALSCHVTVP